MPTAPADGAQPLGFNLEGPFISAAKKGAHNPDLIMNPADVPWSEIEPLVDRLQVTSIPPSSPASLELIPRPRELYARVSIRHSGAARAGAIGGCDGGRDAKSRRLNSMYLGLP